MTSCRGDRGNKHQAQLVQSDSTKTDNPIDSIAANQLDRILALTEFLDNKVQLDTLLDCITHQDRVKLISTLAISQDDSGYIYSDSNYSFRLFLSSKDGEGSIKDTKTVFYDGATKIAFDHYYVLCPVDSDCNDYGFNSENTLIDPKIIEVCGRRFLYSAIEYWCNGMGCGCNLIMIYDIANKQPTFIENYRIHYDGYYVSDFDGDSIPDLLVMRQKSGYAEGFNMETSTLLLYNYKWSKGKFTPYPSGYMYKLYGLAGGQYSPVVYSMTGKGGMSR